MINVRERETVAFLNLFAVVLFCRIYPHVCLDTMSSNFTFLCVSLVFNQEPIVFNEIREKMLPPAIRQRSEMYILQKCHSPIFHIVWISYRTFTQVSNKELDGND